MPRCIRLAVSSASCPAGGRPVGRLRGLLQLELGISKKVSALLRGRLTGFSTDRLLKFITSLGQDVDIVIRARRSTKGRGHLHVVAA